MRRLHLFLGVFLIAFLAIFAIDCKDQSTNPYGSNPSPSPSPGGSSHTVGMAGTVFSPSSLTITKGTTVTWQNNDGIYGSSHTATSDSGSFDTGSIIPGSSKSVTFNTVGTFPYHCLYHGAMGMKGTVIVQ